MHNGCDGYAISTLSPFSKRDPRAKYIAPLAPKDKKTSSAVKGAVYVEYLSTTAYQAINAPLDAVYPLYFSAFITSKTASFINSGYG